MSHSFRKRNAQALYDTHYGPNMTPMVDVVMVILIFFMASTAFLGPEWFLKTYLPSKASSTAPPTPLTRLEIALAADADRHTTATLNRGEPLTLAALEVALATEVKAAGAESCVVPISAAPEVPYEDVVRAHEMCARLGVMKVGLN